MIVRLYLVYIQLYWFICVTMFRRNALRLLRLPISNTFKTTEEHKIYSHFLKLNPCHNCRCLTTNIQHTDPNITNKHVTEKEYLVKIKTDPDTFGSQITKEDVFDEDDFKEKDYLENPPAPGQRLRIKQYADMIKALIRKRKIKEAIDLLEVRILKNDRIKPDSSYLHNLILGACGKVGYTKKAFSLYNRMKQRGLTAHAGTYTALFNACANSPWPEDGLNRARHLREIMIEKRYEPNDSNYNAMIKAFGRCRDLETAFSLVDEMQERMKIKADTLNFLLQACISDTEAGFRHALLVWRKFHEKNVKPNIYSYNLLLRCVRDCGVGDVEMSQNVLHSITESSHLHLEPPKHRYSSNSDMERIETDVTVQENRPNLIARVPYLGDILSISEITKCEDRLLLIGGFSGLLNDMKENQCVPDVKTYTQLLNSIPSTLSAEKELIISMRKLNVKPDVDFYNMLIKKRSMRFDYGLAKEVLNMMTKSRLKPDIITFGVLALGCQTKQEAESLIEEMHNENHRLNAEILGAMLHQGCARFNFTYILKIMEICIEDEIRPNKIFMDRLEEFKKKCKKMSNDNNCSQAKSKNFEKGYKLFNLRYKSWKGEVDPIDEEEIHPWQQFRQDVETDVKHYKDKKESSKFKTRHLSLYRQKKNEVIKEKRNTSKSGSKKLNVIDVKDVKQINNV